MAPDPTITYVTSRWGEPTQTFVRREAAAVQDSGVEVMALSIKRPATPGGTTDASSIIANWLSPLQVVAGLTKALMRRPRTTVSILASVIRRSAIRNLPSSVAAATVGIAWATRGTVGHAHLHSHFGWVSATATWAAARLSGLNYSIVLHAFELHTPRLQDRFTAIPLREATRVFTISQRDAEFTTSRWGVSATVMHMGVPQKWVEEPPVAPERWKLVSIGSLVQKKGHDVLLRALAQGDPRWHLTIIGEGSERATLADLANELGLTGRLHMPGFLEEHDLRRELDRSWGFALACRVADDGDMDGIPVALMEAMARGVPVVTTTVGAMAELVEGAGLLVPPGHPGQFADALELLVSDDSRAHYSAAGRQRIAEEFTCERNAEQVVALATTLR